MPLRACGAVRISEEGQSVWSETTQREAILARAHADGYLMDECDLYTDHARGHKVTRKGYVAILKGVRERRYSAVYVAVLDRWGRDSIERQQRGKEFDTLGVPVISLTEGVDEPGLVRVIRAELSEEESRRIAMRVLPHRRRAAQEGVHMGETPFGYRRVYPEWDGRGRRPSGRLVPLEPDADIVRELFARYASGQWSLRLLAEDLNARGIPSPQDTKRLRAGREPTDRDGNPTRHKWNTTSVANILRNVAYVGDVSFDQKPSGHYLRAEPGSGFVVSGTHAPLVGREVFDAVQRRLADARTSQSVARGAQHAHLVSGLLRCAHCGGLLVPTRGTATTQTRHGDVRCGNRHGGRVPCTARSVRLDIVTAALLSEVARLRGMPWTTEMEARLAGEHADALAALDRALDTKRAELKSFTRQVMMRAEPPSPAQQQVFDELSREQASEIAQLEARRAQIAGDADTLPRLKALHSRLHATEIRDVVRRLSACGDSAAGELRDLVTALVDHATIVERYPETRSTWLRLEVCWTPDVQKLLAAGLLWLDTPPAPPAPPDARTLARRERQRRYRAGRAERAQRSSAP